MNELPLDLLVYKILTDPDLSPPDILGLCQQPGFVLLCRLPKVGRALMNRYYPGVPIDPNNPWRQFRMLADRTKIRYVAYINNSDIENTTNDSQILFPIPQMENYRSMLSKLRVMHVDETDIYVNVYGVPISGPHLIAGTTEMGGDENEYEIYQNLEGAIKSLWYKLVDKIDQHSDPERTQNYGGEIRYRSPVDYRETYGSFRQDILEEGFSLYHYYETHEHYEYGDFSNYGTIIFSIHNTIFVN